MSVSVVIPSTLQRNTVAACVDAALTAARGLGPDAEVLLVANGPGATTGYRGPADPMLRLLTSEPAGVSAARNAGIAAARHDTVLFADDDVLVPPDWCARMAAALGSGAAAVGGPIRVAVGGPVTAFMDHLRMFDATPLDGSPGGLLITASAGLRRDLAPDGPPFDPSRHAGEDSDLALRLRAAGRSIGWLSGGTPAVHHVDEDVRSLVGRSLRDARTAAGLVQRYGHRALSQYLPSPWATYQAVRDGRPQWFRRFGEIGAPEVRAVFTTLSLIWVTCVATGYLEETGRLVGCPLLDVDEDALVDELAAVVAGLVAAGGPVDWAAPPVTFAAGPRADVDERVPVGAVCDAFRRHTAPHEDVPPPLLRALARHDRSWHSGRADEDERVRRLWSDLAPRRAELTLVELDTAARALGLPLSAACSHLDDDAPPLPGPQFSG
ncbi:glycosyltransferase family 2 protein [Dactylosporangium sp. CA-052675]|uniref:glycosyltransferase family 2 protein n=1 Tax=Dactylosporangium sp. CA-052675 TaxID=3239927 RepID=UPI003D93F445